MCEQVGLKVVGLKRVPHRPHSAGSTPWASGVTCRLGIFSEVAVPVHEPHPDLPRWPHGLWQDRRGLAIAEFVPLEIISVDSARLPGAPDIGTAKPHRRWPRSAPPPDRHPWTRASYSARQSSSARPRRSRVRSRHAGACPARGRHHAVLQALFVGLGHAQADPELRAPRSTPTRRCAGGPHADLAKFSTPSPPPAPPNDSQHPACAGSHPPDRPTG